jgi:shikimate kinase
VIALGGGALLVDASLAAVRARAALVHLRVSAETARLRALSQPEQARPLLGEDLDETRARLSARAALYAQSDVEVDADGADPSAVTAAVLAGLERLTAR